MILYHIGIVSVVFVLAAGEAVPSGSIEPYTRLGAVAALGTALLLMLWRTLPTMTKDFLESLNKICDRFDGWEKVRHEDHEELKQLLQKLEKKE